MWTRFPRPEDGPSAPAGRADRCTDPTFADAAPTSGVPRARSGRTYLLERAPELQPFLASAVGIDPSLKVRLLSGTLDTIVPTALNADFAKVLAAAGYDVQVITYEGGRTTDPPDELSLEVFTEVLGL